MRFSGGGCLNWVEGCIPIGSIQCGIRSVNRLPDDIRFISIFCRTSSFIAAGERDCQTDGQKLVSPCADPDKLFVYYG